MSKSAMWVGFTTVPSRKMLFARGRSPGTGFFRIRVSPIQIPWSSTGRSPGGRRQPAWSNGCQLNRPSGLGPAPPTTKEFVPFGPLAQGRKATDNCHAQQLEAAASARSSNSRGRAGNDNLTRCSPAPGRHWVGARILHEQCSKSRRQRRELPAVADYF
jgi:hypothetical protein